MVAWVHVRECGSPRGLTRAVTETICLPSRLSQKTPSRRRPGPSLTHSQSCPRLPGLLHSFWNLHRHLQVPNWIRHYPKRQATCILFKETYWFSNKIHQHRTRTSCDSGNTSWVQVYSPQTFDYNLHWSQESYLFKLHYWLCHLLAIDCCGIWSQHCLPSRQMQYHHRCSFLPSKT
jgi:hypothetical protein